MATVSVATLGLLAPAVVHAAATPGANSITGYTFSQPVKVGNISGLDISDASALQMGDVNNKGQFSMDFSSGNQGGELAYVWDGTSLIKLTDPNGKLPDGAVPSGGNTWSPAGINNNGKVVWTIDTADGATGPHYVMVYDIATKKFTAVARPQDPAPGGGTLEDQGAGPSNRIVPDINDSDQVTYSTGRAGSDGNDHGAVYFVPDITKPAEGSLLASFGTKTTDGKTIQEAWWPDINNSGQVTFCATVDGTTYGIYAADGKGNVDPIIPAGMTIDGVKIGSARWARNNNSGDIVAVVDVNGADQGGAGEGTDDTAVALYSAKDKSVHLVVKPGDKIPGGAFHGVESSRRVVGITDAGQVFLLGVREDGNDGVYRWDPTTNTIDALALGNSTVAGLGKVDGTTKGIGGVTGYHFGVSADGHVAFDAVVDGVEGYVVAAPPAKP